MSTILFWIVVTQLEPSASAPVSHSNRTAQTTGWRSEPATRGTLRLLISCIITLSLCIYTALHLNVPKKGSPKSCIFLQKARWVLMGVFCPEMVAYIAWTQWFAARTLTAEIAENFRSKNRRKYPWTIVHSFYAGMGGFVIDTYDPHEEEYIPGSPRLTLTRSGLLYIVKEFDIPDISEESILDRSKADNLTKGLVCVQAGWLIVQCIGRVGSRLPVTLLEVHTLAHIICALVMYGFWWKKPLAVRDPTPISGDWVRPLSALLFMYSKLNKRKIFPSSLEYPEIDSLLYAPTSGNQDLENGHARTTQGLAYTSDQHRFHVVRGSDPVGICEGPDHGVTQ